MRRPETRWLPAVSGMCCLLALAGIANGYRVEHAAREAQRDAIHSGIITSATVEGSLPSKQCRTRVRLVVGGVERQVSVFADRPYTTGTSVDVPYLPGHPGRVFIVGATPWTWWAAMRPLFVTVAIVAGVLLAGSVVLALRGRGRQRR